MSKVYIGLAAKPGGGKETFTKMFREVAFKDHHNFSIVTSTFSDILKIGWRMIKDLYGLSEPSTKDLQNFSDMIAANRLDALAVAMRQQLTDLEGKNHFADLQVVDGIRRLCDEKLIRSLPNSFLVHVFAEPQKRFERIKLRGQRPGEKEMTWEQFVELDGRPTETLVEDIGSRADFKIDNNGTLEEYETQVKKIYEESLKSLFEKKERP